MLLMMVPETEQGTGRPVILSITRQIMEITGIEQDTNILYPGSLEKEAQLGSRMNDDGEAIKFSANERIFIDVDQTYDEGGFSTNAVFAAEHQPVFIDNGLNVYLKPVYGKTSISINIRYRSKDKIAAERWRDDIKTRMGNLRDVNLHSASYHYLLPPEYIVILKEIHRLRENQAGYGEDFETYFKGHGSKRLSLLTNLIGSQDAWGIAETQQEIVGWFDFTVAPEKGSKEGDNDTWTVSFAYRFSYDKPMACVMKYPLMIHNQVLSKKYRQKEQAYEPEKEARNFSFSNACFNHFAARRHFDPQQNVPGVGIPSVDDFIPDSVYPATMRIITALFTVKPEEPRTILDLSQLGQYQMVAPILDYMRSEANYMTKPYSSMINLALYRGTGIVQYDKLHCDNELKVTSTIDLDIRNYHHLRLSLLMDLNLLDKDALERLRLHGLAFSLMIDAIDPSLKGMGLLPDSNRVTMEQFRKIRDVLDEHRVGTGNNQDYIFSTVESFFVQTHKGKAL